MNGFRVSIVGCAVLGIAGCGGPVRDTADWDVRGMPASARVIARTESTAAAAMADIRSRLDAVVDDLDPGGPGELGRLNREAADRFYEVEDVDLWRCLRLAIDYARESGGAYDPSIGALTRLYRAREGGEAPRPAEIRTTLGSVGWQKLTLAPEAMAVQFRVPGLVVDFGPVRAGCAIDLAVRTFARPGSIAGLVRLGEVAYAWQSPPGEDGWSVDVPDPREPDTTLLAVRLGDRAVAVSGHPRPGAESAAYRPVLDPSTGMPAATDLMAAVAIADSATDAAALAQAVFVAGSLGGSEFLTRTRRTEAILLVRGDGRPPYLLASASLEGRFVPSPALEREVGGDVRYLLPARSE